ncbi:MAG TPA: PA2169 family four-helix-bundle protein [Sphingobacteriaceae bacterium]|nr:PA2169 family four-helix-bundle protein [Sphingobacteriaceae bacterium]
MSTISNTAGVLNDLILINNDRIEGYHKAIEELKGTDTDLFNLFTSFITQSTDLKLALQSEVAALGEEIEEGTTTSGKIYRAWMEVKALFTGKDRQAVLEACEFGEDAAQKAYKEALESDEILENALRLISAQKLELKISHDKVKILRDSEKGLS